LQTAIRSGVRVYLINREHENESLNNIDLHDQKTAP
jgi:hypothetical protein